MQLDMPVASPSALDRLAGIANEIAKSHPGGDDLVREIFALATALVRDQHKAQPIATAPKEAGLTLLLYCPEQGGWQTGEWIAERWTATWTWDFLEPTHWAEAPKRPV
jgi:hypothetical protein